MCPKFARFSSQSVSFNNLNILNVFSNAFELLKIILKKQKKIARQTYPNTCKLILSEMFKFFIKDV